MQQNIRASCPSQAQYTISVRQRSIKASTQINKQVQKSKACLKPSQNPPKKPPSTSNPCSMSKAVKVIQANASNPKLLIALGIGLAAGVVILTETRRRRRRRANAAAQRKDFGAFVVRFELLPFPQPPPPAARLPLSSLTFAIKDMFVFYSPTLSSPDFTVEFRFLFLNFYMNRKQTSFLYCCRVFHKIGWGLLVLKKIDF